MRHFFISLFLLFSVTGYAQYDCDGELGLTDTPFSPYTLTLIKANYPGGGFGVYRLQNSSEENIIVYGFFDVKESTSDSNRHYYLDTKNIHGNRTRLWRLKIKEPNKGWHYSVNAGPITHGYHPWDEIVIKPGNYADLVGRIPHDKEEYIEHHGLGIKYKDHLYQEDYQAYAYRIEYENNKGNYILSAPYCLGP
jgi:hypothetical protein